jgi:hypothetical protein
MHSIWVLTSHHCGLGSIPGLICELSLLLILSLASRVFLRVLWFFSLSKNQHSSSLSAHTTVMCYPCKTKMYILFFVKWLVVVFDVYRVNRLSTLPKGLGTASALEILDVTYNNLNEQSLPGNFFIMSKSYHPVYYNLWTNKIWYSLKKLLIKTRGK